MDLDPARFIRLIGEKAAIGRNLGEVPGEQFPGDGLAGESPQPAFVWPGSRTRMMSRVALGPTSKPKRQVPSRVMDVGHWGIPLVVNRSTVPPSTFWRYRFSTPARADMKMILARRASIVAVHPCQD